MTQPLRLLIVEDLPDDAELMVMRLEDEGFCISWKRVETEKEYREALEEKPDFILADWALPQFSGLRALEILNESALDIPFILVSGSIGEEAAINVLRLGASDYILKDRSRHLGQAVRRTLELRKYRLEKEQAEAELKRRLAELEVLYNISDVLRYLDNLDDLLSALLDQTLEAIQTDAGGIWLMNPADRRLYLCSLRGWFSGYQGIAFNPNEGLIGTAFMLDRPYLCSEYIRDRNISQRYRDKIPPGWGGVCLPIHCNQENIGVLEIAVPLPREINSEELKLLLSIAEMAGIAVHRIRLFEELQKAGAALASAYDETIKGWAGALELHDQETKGHSERVSALTLALAKKMGFDEDQLTHIYRGSLLHDIGKMGVSDSIVLKPGPLTEHEWAIMRNHPLYANEMLSPIVYLRPALNIPYCHHEKFDGTGYPRGYKGTEIPLEARIFAVADVYDALTTERPYRPAWSREAALDYIKKESGTHFDPQVVELFFELISETGQEEP